MPGLIRIPAIVAFLAALAPDVALAGRCDIITPPPTVVRAPAVGFYDVLSLTDAEAAFSVTLENTEGTNAQCRIVFETADTDGQGRLFRVGAPTGLDFNIFIAGATDDLIHAPGTSPLNPFAPTTVRRNTTRTRDFTVNIPAGQMGAPGLFQRQVRVKTFEGQDETILDEAIFTVQTAIEGVAAIYISVIGDATTASGKTAFYDFNALTEDEATVAVSILVQSNASYRFRLTSENGGRLQLRNPPANTGVFDDFVAYTVTSSGAVVPTNGTNFPLGPALPATDPAGDLSLFIVDLESGPQLRPGNYIEGKLAGRYEDRLTISIVAE